MKTVITVCEIKLQGLISKEPEAEHLTQLLNIAVDYQLTDLENLATRAICDDFHFIE